MLIFRKFGIYADQCRLTDVGTDVGDPLHIRHKILEIGIRIDVALALAHSVEVMPLELAHHLAGDLPQRLDLEGRFDIALFKCLLYRLQDFLQKIFQYFELSKCRR